MLEVMPQQKTKIIILPVAWQLKGTEQATTKYQAHSEGSGRHIYGDPKRTPSEALTSLRAACVQFQVLAEATSELLDDSDYTQQIITNAKQ